MIKRAGRAIERDGRGIERTPPPLERMGRSVEWKREFHAAPSRAQSGRAGFGGVAGAAAPALRLLVEPVELGWAADFKQG